MRYDEACAGRSKRCPTTTIVPITAARITVAEAPTNSVYSQIVARIGQNARRLETLSPSAKL